MDMKQIDCSSILLNDFKRQWSDVGDLVMEAVRRVGESGWYILGTEVQAFERTLARHCRVRHAVGVANGMDGLEIALRASGLEHGAAVLTTPLTAFATTLAIQRAGGRPLFVDVDESGLLRLDQVEEVLRERTDVQFILPVHLYGFALDLDRLRAIAERSRVGIVEDCAQAIGARWNREPVGSAGRASAISFYPTKNLGALGDGGALLTDDAAVASQATALRNYGQTAKYKHDLPGLNSRLDELHAAILLVFIEKLASWTERRCQIASRYRRELRHPAVITPALPPKSKSVFHLYPVLVRDPGLREQLAEYLAQQGIQTAVHYPILAGAQQALTPGSFEVLRPLTMAERFASCELSLPINPYLEDTEVERVVRLVNAWRGG
jgi:dTDP-3-amino-3,4,6-trideoxy-alpha-D-glucose transaminase